MMKRMFFILICMALLCAGCGNKSEAAREDDGKQGNTAAIEIADTQAEAGTEDTEGNAAEEEQAAAPENDQENTADVAAGEETEEAAEETAEEQPYEGDLTRRDLFADYIMGKAYAVVSKDFLSALVMSEAVLKTGDEYSVSELEELLLKGTMIENVQPKVSYAPLSIHDGALYAMRLEYEAATDNITYTMIYSDHSGKLEMIFAIDSWSRRDATVNQEGVVFDSGSNGAGSHSFVTYAPDKSFIYRKVTDLDEEYYGFSFYDEEGEPSSTVNAIMNEAGEGNEKATDVVYYREIIDGKRYYYFLKGTAKLTQDTVDYIDKIAKSHNFTFDGKTAADEARSAYEKQLGVEEACKSQEKPYWKALN